MPAGLFNAIEGRKPRQENKEGSRSPREAHAMDGVHDCVQEKERGWEKRTRNM